MLVDEKEDPTPFRRVKHLRVYEGGRPPITTIVYCPTHFDARQTFSIRGRVQKMPASDLSDVLWGERPPVDPV